MGQKSPAKSFCWQANLIIGFLTCLFACLIVGRGSKDVKIATLPRLFFAGPPMQTEGGDVMRAALPFGSVRHPYCQEQPGLMYCQMASANLIPVLLRSRGRSRCAVRTYGRVNCFPMSTSVR